MAAAPPPRWQRCWLPASILLLLVALTLRVWGHNWDANQHLNADDMFVAKEVIKRVQWPTDPATLLDPQASPLNPRRGGEFYVYGTLPLYLVRATVSLLTAVSGDRYFSGYDGILQTGRILSATFDTLTLLLVGLVGWRLWGRWPGLLAASFYAFAIVPIQHSHFYIVDVFMTTFMTATLLCSLLYLYSPPPATPRLDGAKWLLLAGVAVGLAMACKVSAAPVAVLPLAALLLRAGLSWRRVLGGGGLLLLGAVVAFALADPYAVLDARSYLAVLSTQADIQNGVVDQWFSRKYVGTLPFFYLGGQAILLAVGPLVGLAGLAGAILVALRAVRERAAADWLLLLGAFGYFFSVAFVEIKWVRYLLPLTPYCCLFATALCVWLTPTLLPLSRAARRGIVGWVVAGVLLASAMVGAVAIMPIYLTTHTQIAASQWLYANVPLGARIGIETTTTGLPLPLPGHQPAKEYKIVPFDPLADFPSPQAATNLRDWLQQSDYLVIDLTQADLTVPRLPWRYPVQARFYALLKAGQLGFAPLLTATSYPRIGGLSFADDGGWVDASFMDASHPPIRIFYKQRSLTDSEWSGLFASAVQQPSVASRRAP